MPLHNPTTLHERILVMGGYGMGKSFDWLTIAQLSAKTRSPAQFYCLDTDAGSIEVMLAHEFPGLGVGKGGNVHALAVYSWEDLIARLDEVARKMTTDDWLIVDLLGPAWDWVQRYFTERVFHQDIEEYFLAARMAMKPSDKGGNPFEGWKDWPVINGLYQGFTNKLLRLPGHLYAATGADVINNDTDSREAKNIYGAYGVKPRGQKNTGFMFHTVLWKHTFKPQEWKLTTVKDRGRVYLEGVEVTDFARDYLVKTAGWKLGTREVRGGGSGGNGTVQTSVVS